MLFNREYTEVVIFSRWWKVTIREYRDVGPQKCLELRAALIARSTKAISLAWLLRNHILQPRGTIQIWTLSSSPISCIFYALFIISLLLLLFLLFPLVESFHGREIFASKRENGRVPTFGRVFPSAHDQEWAACSLNLRLEMNARCPKYVRPIEEKGDGSVVGPELLSEAWESCFAIEKERKKEGKMMIFFSSSLSEKNCMGCQRGMCEYASMYLKVAFFRWAVMTKHFFCLWKRADEMGHCGLISGQSNKRHVYMPKMAPIAFFVTLT